MTSSPQPTPPPNPSPPPASSSSSSVLQKRTSIAWTQLPEPSERSEPRHGRTQSVAFVHQTGAAGAVSSGSASGAASIRSGRSLSSPPPPPSFQKRVSFDTFDNKDAADFSLTLKSKHKDYSYSRRSRTFLCGTDQNDYSDFALEWLIDELVDDGDEIVCLRVVDKESRIGSGDSSGKDEEKQYRRDARKLLNDIIDKNSDDKAISIILEFSVGKVHETIQRMIHIYEPVILIVGTRGRSLGGIQGLLPGSVSKYCLQHSPIPVIVVRPSTKRDKKKEKRKQDPGRRVYQEMIQTDGLMNHANDSIGRISGGSGDASNNSDRSSPKDNASTESLRELPSPADDAPPGDAGLAQAAAADLQGGGEKRGH